jgi:activator of HSP90 ATPase
MKSFIKNYSIKAPVSKVWAALTEPKLIEQWSGASAIMDSKLGTEFKLWDGDIYGKNIEVKENKILKQEFFGGKWDEPSMVTIELEEKDGITNVNLTHENIPEDNKDDLSGGWDEYYFGPLKELVENN